MTEGFWTGSGFEGAWWAGAGAAGGVACLGTEESGRLEVWPMFCMKFERAVVAEKVVPNRPALFDVALIVLVAVFKTGSGISAWSCRSDRIRACACSSSILRTGTLSWAPKEMV